MRLAGADLQVCDGWLGVSSGENPDLKEHLACANQAGIRA